MFSYKFQKNECLHLGRLISTHDHVISRVDSKRLCTIVSTKKNSVQPSDETMWLRVFFSSLVFTFTHCQAASGKD